MTITDIQQLNDRFGISHHLTFYPGRGDLPVVKIRNAHATATVALHGGQVLTFQPNGSAPVLWVSARAIYAVGTPLRGGIPVCWPWFGPHPTLSHAPAHGLARTAIWQVLGSRVAQGGTTELRLGLEDDDTRRALWPHRFSLQLVVTVGGQLEVDMIAANRDSVPFSYSGALHSYFNVGDVTRITIHGLDGCTYVDQTDGRRRKEQSGPLTIAGETDRIYLDTSADCVIDDPALERRIRIAAAGSSSTVVWNPWVDRARRLADFADDEYRHMLCVETANAADDSVRLEPDQEHHLRAIISVE